jgi:hypothetical protein
MRLVIMSESVFGVPALLLFVVGIALQVAAVVAIIRDSRGRTFGGWDVAALILVILAGPFAAVVFLLARGLVRLRPGGTLRGATTVHEQTPV